MISIMSGESVTFIARGFVSCTVMYYPLDGVFNDNIVTNTWCFSFLFRLFSSPSLITDLQIGWTRIYKSLDVELTIMH